MTKFEWERQLKKGISGLPKAEQQRVLDYYNELFADKIDAGLREQYIISEFGNPYDVANKILVDFYNEGKENPEADAYIYADSDDIDVAFDDEQDTPTAQYPKRISNVPAHREKRRGGNADRDAQPQTDEPASPTDKKKARGAGGLVTVLCVVVYVMLGAFFDLWHPTWLIFLLLPCILTLVEAVIKRNYRIFAYPVFAAFLFMCLGFSFGSWHPSWVVFVTIPLYYVLGDYISKRVKGDNKSGDDKAQNKKQPQDEPFVEAPVSSQKPHRATDDKARGGAKKHTGAMSIVAKVLLTICLVAVAVAMWWCVIGLFSGGIGMIIGGIACIASAFFAGATVNMVLIGAGITVLGLGLIFTFGMAALFKPCFNVCKTFLNTIKNTFNDKENA